ncbi:hypothetical protein [Amycolatopsis aidingensis]|uniref:hypothetical protein n=1 Tax=Amycolatopsis aidingensis TaxID=2842453 RepID=UPI001C0A9F04|nr:hypothetical protein [Amycolatopsis aidingensis]
MTTTDSFKAPTSSTSVTGDGNVTVGGYVTGGISVDVRKSGDTVQVFGTGSGYRDLIVRDEIDPGHLLWLKDRFAEPHEFTEIVKSLHDDKVVFLHGRPRSGRWTTGVWALRAVSGGETPTINVIEFDEDTQLDLRRVAQNARILLDLTKTDSEVLDKGESQLKSFLGTVTGAEAHLVVLLPEPPPPALQALYQGRTKQLIEPAAGHVLRAHLRKTAVPAKIADEPPIIEALASARPADAAWLADLIVREHHLAGEGAAIGTVAEKAVLAYGNWTAELITVFDKEEDRNRRSLLLTVALLSGCSTETQYWAERELLTIAGYPPPPGKLLEGRGFAGRLTELKGVSFTDDRARFDRFYYDRSVLRHVWHGYHERREELVDWVIALGLGQRPRLDDAARAGLVSRFLDLCASQDAAKFITKVAEKWAVSGKAVPARMAVDLVTAAALDDRSAPVVHRQLNEWARKPDLTAALVNLVLSVCQSKFGRKHTDKALTRLGNLALHNDRWVNDEVVTAVLALVRDNGALPQALTKLDEWLRSGKERQWAVSVRILCELLSADAGEFIGVHRQPLVRIWRAQLALGDDALVHEAIGSWLDLATGSDQQAFLLGVLGEAAATSDTPLAQIGAVRMAADRWLGFVPRYWEDHDRIDPRLAVHQALAEELLTRHPFTPQPIHDRDS